ncbi:hypothetical protein A2477_02290 [Candidatus Falkowbacteria bacterium RIFOXYC2_FULL_47_12]|uniref:Epoxyqueuosine reductase QueH n=2 Tax=Candidatus Falkowiibacteriota TaxID=1752728 RepID=A0A1F5TQB3_9BACT|nr:MAG: hypothetical protein A2242_03545 [Candidatus Falkowbacteria bacterium RIFOXYA2_FULL_47_9]OGF41047.1 MAG: hypothetical protein A2477_02290 [Candidatus Falkowbacteria bacterium RIFOXYC2_FULL_47_12]
MPKQKLLLNVCCIGCGVSVCKKLSSDYDVTLFFYNPNIFPADEYERRLAETRRVAKSMSLELIAGAYEHTMWRTAVQGLESELEGGARCPVCFRLRLEKTASLAAEKGFDIFASTLTVSPHKDARVINDIGLQLGKTYGVAYLASDFKKQGGFQESCKLSKELNLYRQDYCGCEFSLHERQLRKKYA